MEQSGEEKSVSEQQEQLWMAAEAYISGRMDLEDFAEKERSLEANYEAAMLALAKKSRQQAKRKPPSNY